MKNKIVLPPMPGAKYFVHFVILFMLTVIVLHSATAEAGNFWVPNSNATASSCPSTTGTTSGAATACPNGGWAQDSSVKFLMAIFGNVVLSIASGTVTPDNPMPIIPTLLGVLNASMLAIGTLVMGYNFLGGAVQTAKDGEFLGKKWDTTMVPLRTAAGFGALLPTAAGYSFIQIFLIWVGLQAIGLAGTVWQASINYFQNETLLGAPFIATDKTAEQIFLMSACQQAAPTFGWPTPTNTGDQIGSPPTVPSNGSSGSSAGYITLSIPTMESMTSSGLCGTISWSQTPMWKSEYSTVASFFDGANGSSTNSTVNQSNPLFNWMGRQPQIVTSVNATPFSSFNLDNTPDQIELMSSQAISDFEAQVRAAHGAIINNMLAGNDAASFCTSMPTATNSTLQTWQPQSQPSTANNAFAMLKAYAGAMSVTTDGTKLSFAATTPPATTGAVTPASNVANAPGPYFNAIALAQTKYETELTCAVNAALQNTLFDPTEENGGATGNSANTSTSGQGGTSNNWWMQKMITQMQAGGWIHAGTFYMKIGHLNNAIQSKINQAISTMYTMPNLEAMSNASQNSAFAAFLINIKESLQGGHELSRTVDNQVGNEGMMHRAWQRITGAFTDSFLNFALVGKLGNNGLDPLIQMKNVGDTILVTAETVTILSSETLMNALGGSKGSSSSGGSSGGNLIATIVGLLIGLMLVMGMYLAVILPMTPYMIWVGGVIMYFISFIFAIVASPLWMIAHMHPEGHDVTGNGSPGWMFTLYILTKPVLMVIFLFFAMVLIKPVMVFINGGYFEAISNMTEGSMAGIATLLGTIIMYSALSTNAIYRVFSMINTGPDHVYRWIGGSDAVGAEGNQWAQQDMQESRSAAMNRGADGLGQVLGSGGTKVRDTASRSYIS